MIEKIKSLTKDTAIYGISTIVGRFLGFLLVPLYTNVFSEADFGIYSNIYAYLAFFNIFFIYGMDAAYMKYASLAEDSERKKVFSTPYILVLITTVLLVILMLAFKNTINVIMQVPDTYSNLIYYVTGIVFFDTIVMIPFSYLRLYNNARKFATVKIVNILINLLLNIILIFNYKMGIEAVFISNFIASVVTFLIMTPDISKNMSLVFSKEIIKKMLKFGLPYLPASLAAIVVQVIDRPVMMLLKGPEATGIYQANYKLGIFMMLVVSMFQYAWQPFFLVNAKEKDAKEIFSKVLTLFVTAAAVIWIFISLFIDNAASFEIFSGRSLIGKEFLSGIHIVPIILFAYIFHGIYINFTAGIYIEEKTNYLPLITGIGAAGNVVSNFLLIPYLGLTGAAISTFISYFLMAAANYIISQKFYPVKYEIRKVTSVILLITVTIFIYYFLYTNNQLTFLIKLLMLFVFLASMFLLGIVKTEDLKKTLTLFLRKK